MMHPAKQRAVLPQHSQTALPAEIYYQPTHIGGSLGFGVKSKLEDFWEKLEAEAGAEALAPGVGRGGDLRQSLNNFLFPATAVSQLIVPYNPSRIYLLLQNLGGANVFVGFGRTANVLNGVRLSSGGGFYEPILGTTSSVHGISAGATSNVVVVEGFRSR